MEGGKEVRKEDRGQRETLTGKNESSIHESMKKKRKFIASFEVASQIEKVMATVHDTCLAKMEKALNLLGGKHEQEMYSN